MIARVIRGRGFGGTVRYCAQKALGDRSLGSSVLSGDPNGPSEREIIYQLRAVTSARDAARPVVHIPVRPRSGEHLTEEQWLMVAERVRTEMGYENCPWVAYLHNNERVPGQHLHLVLSRVTFDGKIVSDQYERFRVMEVMRGLEVDLRLEPVQSGERSRPQAYPHDAKGRAQDREFIMLRAQIDAAGVNARTIPGFVERLEAAGVRVHLKTSRNGHLQGASFQLASSERIWRGSDLGRSYSIGRLAGRFGLAQEGDVLRAVELGPRDLERLRSVGLEPDRVEASGGGRAVASWLVQGSPRDQDVYQRMVQAAVPGRLCERESGDRAWSATVAASALEARSQQIAAAVSSKTQSAAAVIVLGQGPEALREASRQTDVLLQRYAQGLRSGERQDRLSALWLEIVRLTGVRGVRPDILGRRGLGQQLSGLGSIAQTPNAVRSRLLRREPGYVSAPLIRGELTSFPPHLLDPSLRQERRQFNRAANGILGERESTALLRLADSLGRSREDRRIRDRLEGRLREVERAAALWGGRRSGRSVTPPERQKNAAAARRFVSRSLRGHLRQAERQVGNQLARTAWAVVPRPHLPGLGLLAKVNAGVRWTEELGRTVMVIEAAIRREHSPGLRRDANHLDRVAAGDVSTYRLLRLTGGRPRPVAVQQEAGPAKNWSAAIREYRRSRAELVRFARTAVREGKPRREVDKVLANRAAAVLVARERLVNIGLERLGIPSLRMLSGTARERTEVLARFAHGCRTAGLSVGTAARVVAEVGPVVLGGFLAGAAVTLISRVVFQQAFGLGRNLAKEFLYGDRDRERGR